MLLPGESKYLAVLFALCVIIFIMSLGIGWSYRFAEWVISLWNEPQDPRPQRILTQPWYPPRPAARYTDEQDTRSERHTKPTRRRPELVA